LQEQFNEYINHYLNGLSMKKILFFLFFLSIQALAQKNTTALPRSTPEAEGVSSEGIANFVEAASKSKHEFHSYMVIRHGKVVAEGWWNPYRPDLKHTLYSCSKSFTATAVGFAVTEKRLTVEDKVISFFPNDLPDTVSDNLAALRIKDLLSMSVGHETEPSFVVTTDNWVKSYLKVPIKYQPGSRFLYNSGATYLLSTIVQKVTGEKIIDYLKPRLFNPLGIEGMDWEISPQGINTGGWGLRLKTEDMAKFAQLFLQKGVWQGKQILSAAWVEEASTIKILQNPDLAQSKRDSSDWQQGYCYQMWRSRNNSYRGDGANGQYMLVFPDKDAVIAVTCETQDMQGEFNLIWQYLYPALKDTKLPSTPSVLSALKAKNATLALPIAPKNALSPLENTLVNSVFNVISTDKTLKNIGFDFKNGVCTVTFKTDTASHQIAFGSGIWVYGETTKKGPYLVARAQNNRVGLSPYKVAGSYTWKDDKTLELTLRYIESPHTETIVCTFDGDVASVDFINIFNKNTKRTPVKGISAKKWNNPPRLIVRGDDMGFSHSANEALIKTYKEGIETSIEVIVPSPWFPEAVKLLEQNKSIDVGLHFAITSEWDNVKWRPLTDAPSLRNQDGYFYPMMFQNAHYPKQAVSEIAWKKEDYEKELRAQIDMALKYIPRLSHVSGHMGSLAFSPEAKEIARRVGKEYKLQMVDAESAKDNGINYIGFDFAKKTTEERIQGFIDMLDKLEEGKTYVFVEHPGLDTDELRAIYHIGYEDVAKGRQDVTTIFTSEKVKEAIARKGIQLVSYKEVLNKK
jgi:CubicO group peptidase (beta-lactamase class C family)/predicted glycoside hydrolase/deacetylase ChbG (UPF0249 family)